MKTSNYFLSVEKTRKLKNEFSLDLRNVCNDYELFWQRDDSGNISVVYKVWDIEKYIPALNAEQLYAILPLDIYTPECGKCTLNVSSDIINDKEEFIVSYDMSKDKNYPYVTFSNERLVDALFDAIEYCYNEKHFQSDAFMNEETEIQTD